MAVRMLYIIITVSLLSSFSRNFCCLKSVCAVCPYLSTLTAHHSTVLVSHDVRCMGEMGEIPLFMTCKCSHQCAAQDACMVTELVM